MIMMKYIIGCDDNDEVQYWLMIMMRYIIGCDDNDEVQYWL
jgi:hypothetical protein